jgi:hypothetical protein
VLEQDGNVNIMTVAALFIRGTAPYVRVNQDAYFVLEGQPFRVKQKK